MTWEIIGVLGGLYGLVLGTSGAIWWRLGKINGTVGAQGNAIVKLEGQVAKHPDECPFGKDLRSHQHITPSGTEVVV